MNLFHQLHPHLSLSQPQHTDRPEDYLLSEELIGAVNVAMASGQPLLITGEPGTGKTQLAYKLAIELHQQDNQFLREPLVFHTKTSSVASELFYTYDALGHFQKANIKQAGTSTSSVDHIQLQALGKAIALTHASQHPRLLSSDQNAHSVVLIDEIDKAPRDFPNDILNEIDQQEFYIKEADNYRVEKGKEGKILVIMTSNSEKNLPEPFLRRCIYFHIEFPSHAQLRDIVSLKLGSQSRYFDDELIQHFLEIREAVNKKKPATAELITWLRVLEVSQFIQDDFNLYELTERQRYILALSYSAIAKNKEDLALIKSRFLS